MRDERAAASAPSSTTGYPLVGASASRAERGAYLGALVAGIVLVYVYRLYTQTGDVAPDSLWGYVFAISGTALLLLVGVGYSVRKRRARHARVRLHTMLAWHVVGALLGVALIFMHSAGNFNPRTGTYALYGLIAATLSGVIGRLFDRVCPRLAAAAAAQALTADGVDRLVALQQQLTDAQVYGATQRRVAPRRRQTDAPWDLAYYDLDADGGAISALLDQDGPAAYAIQTQRAMSAATTRLPPKPPSLQPRLLRPATGAGDVAGREQVFIGMIRAWRRLHVVLCVVALGLLIWHISYAVMLLIGAR
ncbi:MAG TPA: hypothetical protein VMV29_07010 [Ktedonobacterales bacterium]|nr:hypothetical protein [Ktedonobacterales bacterium]